MASYTAQLKALLFKAGCRLERQGKGDHEIWFSPITTIRFPVDSKIKSIKLSRDILPTQF
jgi:hypothetical protein